MLQIESAGLRDSRYAARYFVGAGVDIGGKPDPLSLYSECFPGISSLRTWDIEDGDAQLMENAADEEASTLCSRRIVSNTSPGDPAEEGLRNWFRILKPGDHLVITVPDEDLYEQGV